MAIDRADDVALPRAPAGADAPRSIADQAEPPEAADEPGAGRSETETTAADLRQQQLAEHARYRGAVDADYQAAARDAWAKAVPELRAAWEEHKQKYPERMEVPAQTQPDGSWAAGGHRRLNPEQHAEASKCSADLRDEADRVILPAMKRVEAADPERRLAGLEHMLKGEDRLKEKIADAMSVEPHLTARQALDKVPDAIRFTLTYNGERYTDGVIADVDSLKSEGFELIKLKNLWASEQYKGINSQWRRPETGVRFEMQFHTPASLEAKELTHEAYERLRRSETETSRPERDELEAFQGRANSLLAAPPDVDTIKDFPEKKR
jgi:hypothetical protein